MHFSTRPERRPPNYFSRSLQLRLMMAVGSLMLVLLLMSEARKPENWQWMWAGAEPSASEPIDTRLDPPQRSTSQDPPGTVYADAGQDAGELVPEAQEQEDPLEVFREKAWDYSLRQLDRENRLALDAVLKASRTGSAPLQEHLEHWSEGIGQLENAWNEYIEQTTDELESTGDKIAAKQKEAWLDALYTLKFEWIAQLRPALHAPLAGRSWSEPEQRGLMEIQATIDQLDLQRVEDDTVWRPDEQYAWFRLLGMLEDSTSEQLQEQSLGPASFLQLFKQPEQYRGKLVTVQGNARRVYRVGAPPNIHGIEQYYIFWVKPASGQQSPLVVYALETPAGFPEIQDEDADGQTTATSLNEEVTFQAFFFKRWAYRAQDGLNTAPLLLAKSPLWEPSTAASSSPDGLPLRTIGLSVAAVMILSIGLAYLAYASSNSRTRARQAAQDDLSRLMAEQQEATRVDEHLRELAERDRREGA